MAKIVPQTTQAKLVIEAKKNGYTCGNSLKDRSYKCPNCGQNSVILFRKPNHPDIAACNVCGFRKVNATNPSGKVCLNCGRPLVKNKKFCNRKCQVDYNSKGSAQGGE